MPRTKRPGWSRITVTVSAEVARYIRVQAAEQGIEMGTFVDKTMGALLRSAQEPHGPAAPPHDPAPAARAPGTVPPAGPSRPDPMDTYPAEVSGDNPTRMAEFTYQKAIAHPGSGVFSPLKHLEVADHGAPTAISEALFRAIIASALSATDVEVGGGFGARTLRFLDALLQTLDQFSRQLQAEFPDDAFRMALWTPQSAAAFGILFGKRLGAPAPGRDPEGTANTVSGAVIAMLKGLARTSPNLPELLKRAAPAQLASLLALSETLARKRDQRSPDGDASDSGYGYFT